MEILNSGLYFLVDRITINLAPADLKKVIIRLLKCIYVRYTY